MVYPILEVVRIGCDDAHVPRTHVNEMTGHRILITVGKARSEPILLFNDVQVDGCRGALSFLKKWMHLSHKLTEHGCAGETAADNRQSVGALFSQIFISLTCRVCVIDASIPMKNLSTDR